MEIFCKMQGTQSQCYVITWRNGMEEGGGKEV